VDEKSHVRVRQEAFSHKYAFPARGTITILVTGRGGEGGKLLITDYGLRITDYGFTDHVGRREGQGMGDG
jgi:hypothetical protein